MKFKEGLVTPPPAISAAYGYHVGCYGVPKKKVNKVWQAVPYTEAELTVWFSCRESFHAYADIIGGMLNSYFFLTKTPEPVADLVWRVEYHLNVPHSEFQKSSEPTEKCPPCVLVTPSSWWREDRMRHNFYSIVLRCGERNYTPDTPLMDILMKDPYLASTRPAVERFLDGYTCFEGTAVNSVNGSWYNYFTSDIKNHNSLVKR